MNRWGYQSPDERPPGDGSRHIPASSASWRFLRGCKFRASVSVSLVRSSVFPSTRFPGSARYQQKYQQMCWYLRGLLRTYYRQETVCFLEVADYIGQPWIASWCPRSESNQHLMITNQLHDLHATGAEARRTCLEGGIIADENRPSRANVSGSFEASTLY